MTVNQIQDEIVDEFSDIEDLMQHISNHKLSQSRIDGAKTVLHEVFAYAIKIRVITENPVEFTDMEFYGTEAEEKVPYTLEQIQQIFKTVPDDSPYRIVFVLGIFCGLRIGEILGLTWDHVDFEKGTIKIDGKEYKVTSIADKALYNKTKVSSVTIGTNVTSIGKEAFKNCKKLTTITIQSTKLKTVGKNALNGIKSTAKVKVSKSKITAYKKLFKGKGQSSKVKIQGINVR